MKKTVIFLAVFLLAQTIAAETGPLTHKFKFYTVSEGKKVPGRERPNFGYRLMKTFPLRVKEFTFPAPYIDHNALQIKKTAEEEILTQIAEWRHKNAYHIVNTVYDYIVNNIEDRKVIYEIKDDFHKIYYSGAGVLKEKKGSNLEKCRAAVALLRYFTIPSRIVGYKNRYAVEYFLRPLEGDSLWHVMDFSEPIDRKEKMYMPVEWHPVDKKELLAVQITAGEASVVKKGSREFFFSGKRTRSEIQEIFRGFYEKNAVPESDYKAGRDFYLIRETEYEITMKDKSGEVSINFVMPLVNRDVFKKRKDKGTLATGGFYVKTEDKALGIKFKRAHTRKNPPQRGMVYHLPVVFSVKK
ncbi:MAG: hypothetical protein ACLFP1_02525 [Candidatus Goldiibacteriota bacterium]